MLIVHKKTDPVDTIKMRVLEKALHLYHLLSFYCTQELFLALYQTRKCVLGTPCTTKRQELFIMNGSHLDVNRVVYTEGKQLSIEYC